MTPAEAIPDGVLRPHAGPQTAFLSSTADICVGGGQRGGGKTRGLLLEATRHVHRPAFNAVLFRRTIPRLTMTGGPWPESFNVFPHTPAPGTPGRMEWAWPTASGRKGARVQFRGLEHEKNKLDWKGAQIGLLLFDQLEEFTAGQFWELTATLRSVSGVKPYLRATVNPVPREDPTGGWIRDLLDWWIDDATGYADPSRAGAVRWLVRDDEEVLQWYDSAAAAKAMHPKKTPLSVAFVPMGLEDNPTLREKDPDYEAKLELLPYVERQRYRYGNWNVRAGKGTILKREWFQFIRPDEVEALGWRPTVRFWDTAATDPREQQRKGLDPDWTAGARVSLELRGDDLAPRIFVEEIKHRQLGPFAVEQLIAATARDDGPYVCIREEQEPGASGKTVVSMRQASAEMAGFDYQARPSSGSKYVNWKPFCAQAEQGNVFLVGTEQTPWIKAFLAEAENVPEGHDDQVDAVSRAYLELRHRGAGQGGVVAIAGFRRA